jgi:methyltransferase (TIGR00027 family)
MSAKQTEKVDLAGVKETLLYTLYYRALDQRSKSSIVGDPWAPEVVARIEDNKGLRTAKWGASGRFTPLLRARRLDDWTRRFLAHHSDAIVLHLGCGLDSRAFRIDTPPGVDWFDLDYPEVIELRRRLYPERDHYRMIASSVTDPHWLTGIPADRPVLVVAEGLMMYLTQTELMRLLERLAERFSRGEMAFDAVGALQAKMSKLFKWTLGDPHDLERWNPALTLLEQVPVTADFQRIPIRRYRVLFQLMNRVPATHNAMTLLRYGLHRDSERPPRDRSGRPKKHPF